ncbi:MAG TPA: TetR/AcrR family transcriptional regulator [Anaerovoracaceae bacterium]|nr:TetR/AcrR family transcriptional regulator [Anaerovoracaceae bacterium]
MDKKQAALEATLELIAGQGFHGTPMSQIAQKANIGVGTIYRYFSGKEELINELYLFIKKRMTDEIMKNCHRDKPVQENFREVLKEVICYMAAHPAELSFHEQYSNSPLITQVTKEQGVQIMGPVAGLFERARSEGLIKELPDDILLTMVMGAVFSLAKLYISAGIDIQNDALAAETDAVWDMIKK